MTFNSSYTRTATNYDNDGRSNDVRYERKPCRELWASFMLLYVG